MAKATKKAPTVPAIPAGYREARAAMAGFFTREESNTLIGTLMGHFTVKGKFGAKKVYRVKVTEGETTVENKDGQSLVEAGAIVAIDETGWLKSLSDVGEGEDVFIRCLGKDGEDQKSPWKFQVCVKE